MKILIPLFSPATGTWGGLTRVLALAAEAKTRGHEVAFCASGILEKNLSTKGFKVYGLPATTMFGLPGPISRIIESRSQRASLPIKAGKSFGSIWFVLRLSGYARTNYLLKLVEAEQKAAQDFAADLIFTDLDPAAFVTARLLQLPVASTYSQIMTHGHKSRSWYKMQRALAGVLKAHAQPDSTPDEIMFGEQVMKLIPSIPELDDADPQRSDIAYVGPMLGSIGQSDATQDFDVDNNKQHVFVYTGTGSVSLNKLERVLPRVFDDKSKRICHVAAQSLTQKKRLANVYFYPYLPAEKLLPHCDFTICHGGQNTIIQSLLNDVPLIILPGPIFERRYNAQKAQTAQAAVMGELNQFNRDWLKKALNKHAELKNGASRLGQKLSAYGGAKTAMKELEKLLNKTA